MVGRDKAKGTRIERFFKGSVQEVSKSVREASMQTAGMVAVARNPVPARYVKKNGAPGAIQAALGLGKIMLAGRGAPDSRKQGSLEIINKIVEHLGGHFQMKAKIEKLSLRQEGGLDIGKLLLREQKKHYELTFWNEYMTLDADGKRIATFPDLIMTFDSETASPLISAEIKENREIFVIAVPSNKLILGAGMRDLALLKTVEDAVGKEILRYR
jgi:hypothetical protein